jgi:hypothetical protein
MAKKNIQDTNQTVTHSFIKGLNKDSDPSYVQEGMWTHAINASNNTIEGDVGSLSNESSNFLCISTGLSMPVTVAHKYIIGAIYLFSDKWIVYTAGHNALGKPVMSEIGLFEEEPCRYRPIVQDACLKFDKRYLISGSSRQKEDCSWQVYWADGLNPDRYLNVGDPKLWPGSDFTWAGGGSSSMNYYSNGTVNDFLWPGVAWDQNCTKSGCKVCINVNSLDCNKIRLARLMETPCLKLSLGTVGGTLANGTYFAVIAYLIKGQRVTDYFSQSNNQFIFTPNDLEGALDLEISADTENFDEFVLVIVQNINQGTVAKQIGVYPTSTTSITVDQITPTLITVPLEQLPLTTPVFEKSDQITDVNNYLLRVGPTSKFEFNYQPLANLINTKWASVEYPADYYVKGGNKTNYLRDEVYCFFIRWVYDTGDKTSSYHIPGRAPKNFKLPVTGQNVLETDILHTKNSLYNDDRVFEVYNTATTLGGAGVVNTFTDDGGKVIAVGEMGYWESTEIYPQNRPDIWNSSSYCWTNVPRDPVTGEPIKSNKYDLCGLPLRHHKFPEDYINNDATTDAVHFRPNTSSATTGDELFIRIMGVYFENITLPKDNDGNDIPGIVGYEILRGSREGNKTIIAKGMINNFRTYNIKGAVARGRTGLYANYPFNCAVPPNSSQTGFDYNYGFNDPYIKVTNDNNGVLSQNIPEDIISFHSPDTMFRTPFLATTEVKLYGYLSGYANQLFKEADNHPKFKLLSDATVVIMIVGGIAEAIISMIGKRIINQPDIKSPVQQIPLGAVTGNAAQAAAIAALTFPGVPATPFTPAIPGGPLEIYNTFMYNYYSSLLPIADVFVMLSPINGGFDNTSYAEAQQLLITALNATSSVSGVPPIVQTGTIELPQWAYLPTPLRVLGAANQLAFYFSEGASVILDVFYAAIRYKQYALQQVAHGFYSNMTKVAQDNSVADTFRFKSVESFYLRDNIQELSRYQDYVGVNKSYSINNIRRPDTVVIRTLSGPYYNPAYPTGVNTGPKLIGVSWPSGNPVGGVDKSLVTIGSLLEDQGSASPTSLPSGALPDFDKIDTPFSTPIASHYAAIKGRVRNQYGQLDGVKQVIITPCEQKYDQNNILITDLIQKGPYQCPNNGLSYKYRIIGRSPILFNGDTYINRYTEKNTMLFFYDWLYNQPDGFEYNYFLRSSIPNPRFAVNSQRYEVANLAETLDFTNISNPGTGSLPTSFYELDNKRWKYSNDTNGIGYPGLFTVKDSYFYLANSSIRDFFVESDVLVDFRKQGFAIQDRHYDPYKFTDYVSMFNMDPLIISKGNVYTYDYSLSVSKLYNQYFSAGIMQNRYYDPNISELCYSYYPDRIIYSLPQQNEAIKDSWFIYLVNNYKAFLSQISGVKSINKSGIFITFKNDSPQMFQGVDTLQTDLGTKITIGDGGLFSQPQQSITNADRPYEYGSSQNRLSVISSPIGIFYISQNQGKILAYNQGLQEISQNGMRWWFTLFLPYRLTDDFPEYPWVDNPVAGIGCQSVYDNTNGILYFCKKDYKLKESMKGKVIYVPLTAKGLGDYFTLKDNPSVRIILGEAGSNALWKQYFDSASWTISYDPKNQFWISFHDWHPDLVIPTKDTFLTTKFNGAWKHNVLCSDFGKYYGEQKAFEVEIPLVTGQTVTTLRSFEYILECYKRNPISCVDQHHVLDFNFDQAVVYNSEQVSGYLNLNIFPKNNIPLSLNYPRLNGNLNSFDVLFSKEENKYRFNQFWDITKDRGEFPIGSNYPPTGPLVPGTTQLLGNYESQYTWITGPDGYTRILNPTNMDYSKSLLQRKKFRHYLNFLNLRKTNSDGVNMNLKITNSKNQISIR